MAASFDSAALNDLQVAFLRSRSDADLGAYYKALMEATRVLLRAYCRRINLHLASEQAEEAVYAAVTRLVDFYLRHTEITKPLPIVGRLNNEILYQLHSKSKKKHDLACVELDPLMAAPEPEPQLDQSAFLTDVLQDTRVDGKRIAYILATSRYYRSAIKKLDKFTDRAWIYNHAIQLHTIWRALDKERQA